MPPRTVNPHPVEGDGEPASQRRTVGTAVLTSVVESQTDHIPPEFFFAEATGADVRRHPWLVPEYADADGAVSLRVRAFVVEIDGLIVMVDPWVGNGKVRTLPFWHEQSWPFLERLTSAGFGPDDVGLVVHTHFHADHVGWDTRRHGDRCVPTFTRARHLSTEADLEYCRTWAMEGEDVYGDSITPIFGRAWPTS